MLQKILVTIDNSPMSQQVFEEAMALAKMSGAKLMLMHILSTEEEGSPDVSFPFGLEYSPDVTNEVLEFYRKQWQEFASRNLDRLRVLAETAIAAGVSAEFTQNPGSPGRTICEFAQTWGADTIIIGRRGRAGFKELFLGSVSNYVLHHAPCSVFVVQHQVTAAKAEPLQDKQTTAVSSS